MRVFHACFILESLDDPGCLAGWTPVASRTVDVPDDPDATTWHVHWYRLRREALEERLPRLAAAMRRNWYGHAFDDQDLVVVLHGRWFWAQPRDRSTWQPFIAYGETVGVGRKWTESIPVTPPTWVTG